MPHPFRIACSPVRHLSHVPHLHQWSDVHMKSCAQTQQLFLTSFKMISLMAPAGCQSVLVRARHHQGQHWPVASSRPAAMVPCSSQVNSSTCAALKSTRCLAASRWEVGPSEAAEAGKGNGVFVLMLANMLAFFADHLLHLPGMSALYLHHAHPQWYQFLSHQFLHANWEHLLNNMFFLLTFGTMVEQTEGPWGLGFFYLFGGLGAALLSFLLSPRNSVSVGASGAIFAIFTVTVLTRLTQFNLRRLLESVVLGQFVVRQVLGEVQQQVAGSLVVAGLHVSHVAHLGGALAGVLLVLLLSRVPTDTGGSSKV